MFVPNLWNTLEYGYQCFGSGLDADPGRPKLSLKLEEVSVCRAGGFSWSLNSPLQEFKETFITVFLEEKKTLFNF
jgi:hypothetical protein